MSVPRFVARVILFSVASSGAMLAQQPVDALPALASIKAIHVTGFGQMTGPDRDIAACLMEKLAAKGPFTFPDSPDSADAVLTWTSKLPSGFSRHMWSISPRIAATLATPSGRVIWTGNNSYKKSTTIWGDRNIACGLANGLVNKLTRDIRK